MRILRDYILKDFFSAFIFSLLSLSLIMLLGNLMKLSDMIIRKEVNLFAALKIFLFFIPYLLGFTIPLSFLLGILLCMGRLAVDNELVAINVAGISIFRILRFFLFLGVIFSLFLFILQDKVIADFHHRYRTQIKRIYTKNISSLIEPGLFLDNFQNYIIYVSDKEGNKLKNMFIYEIAEDKTSKVTFAKRGEFVIEDDILKLKLEDGFRDETELQNKEGFYRLNFKMFFMDIPIKKEIPKKAKKKPSDMRLKELKKEIKRLEKIGINPVELRGEFHKRISFPFSILPFIILGFGVSLAIKHRERSINFGIAFCIAGIYYLLFILGEALIEYHLIFPWLGMWLPNIVIGLTGVYLLYKNAYFR